LAGGVYYKMRGTGTSTSKSAELNTPLTAETPKPKIQNEQDDERYKKGEFYISSEK
jgi:hypothetical protein